MSDVPLGPDVASCLPPEPEIKALDLPDYEFSGVTVRHRVRSGDNLGVIARRYHVSVNQLCRWNRITGRTILRPGRLLVVSRPQPRIETAFSISRKYGLTVAELAALNGLNVAHPAVRIGQALRVAKASGM